MMLTSFSRLKRINKHFLPTLGVVCVVGVTVSFNKTNGMSSVSAAASELLEPLLQSLDNSLLRELTPDPESKKLFPNKISRAVKSGHWVNVLPTPLAEPFLIAYSPDMAKKLGMNDQTCNSKICLQLFSGDTSVMPELKPWSTPYAVSVMGSPILAPDPFRGYGYGDGRAISIGEFVTDSNERWELQLKGAGTTPFARNFDGRAVLRSSVREFLVSEAMYHLGVPTTRALFLVASGSEYVHRAWYPDNMNKQKYEYPPNMTIQERCAITCRAAPSFLRIGQVELFSRRVRRGLPNAEVQLTKLLEHAFIREFPEISGNSLKDKLFQMLRIVAQRYAILTAQWIRVGYVQGNMNSDNCLLSGRTMDYGPFGFMEEYDPLWTPFTSDPQRKFGFERQPIAAQVNLATLADAVLCLLDDNKNDIEEVKKIINHDYPSILNDELEEMRRKKLGLNKWDKNMFDELWNPLYKLLKGLDYTIFWRQLSYYSKDMATDDNSTIIQHLEPAFYENVDEKQREELCDWVRLWLTKVIADGSDDISRKKEMRAVSPKFIPREWMLAEAYTAAEAGDYSSFNQLVSLFEKPYDEHPKFDKYYCRTPDNMRKKGGISFYS